MKTSLGGIIGTCYDPCAGVCLKGRALWGQTQGGYKAVGARCKIGWGAVTGGWQRGWGWYWGCARAFEWS